MKAERKGSVVPPSDESIAARVVVLTLLYSLIVLMLRSAEGASLSLFLEHLGAAKLPYTFLAISLVDLPLALVYMRLSPRIPNRLLLALLTLLLIASLGGARLLSGVHLGAGLFASYMAATILNTFLVIQWGVTLLDFFTVEESRRAFPLIYTGAHAGGFAAGLLLRHLALPLGSENLLVFVPGGAAALVCLLAALASRLQEGRAWRQGDAARARPTGVFRKLGLLRTSPLLRAIALATAMMVLLRLAIRYCYGASFADAFPSPDDLTRFIGTYTIFASLAGIAMQALFTPVLLRRLGAGRTNVLYSLFVTSAFAWLALWPGLASAIAGRATDQDLKSAVKTPLSAIFYEAMGERSRADARAIILGIVSPASSFVSSLILVAVAEGGIPPTLVAAAGAVLSLAFIVLSHAQGRSYGRALEELLLSWLRRKKGSDDVTLEDAVHAGLRTEERRINDMAREVSRRRKGE